MKFGVHLGLFLVISTTAIGCDGSGSWRAKAPVEPQKIVGAASIPTEALELNESLNQQEAFKLEAADLNTLSQEQVATATDLSELNPLTTK